VTILVGYGGGGRGRSGLELAAHFARSGGEPLRVVTIVPASWTVPSPAKVDAEFTQWAKARGQAASDEAAAYLRERAPGVAAECVWRQGRSIPRALLAEAEDAGAQLLVLGAATDGAHGHVVAGSTADRLLHSSPVPVAVATRGYRAAPDSSVPRVTCAFRSDEASRATLELTAAFCTQVGAGLRVATFAVRGRTMYPPEVPLTSEDEVLAAYVTQSSAAQEEAIKALQAAGIAPEPTTSVVATGRYWAEALEDVEWEPGEVLVVGSSAGGVLARVFLGSSATKIVRHSPVPVVVVPAGSG
jgi:nucleotide-binding universal stress UspA family protein